MKNLFLVTVLSFLPVLTHANTVSQQQVTALVKKFYSTYVFGHKDLTYSVAQTYGTTQFLDKLERAYEYDCYSAPCYGTFDLRTGHQDGPSNVSKVTNVTNQGNGWYKVSFIDMGIKGTKNVKIISVNGKPKFADYK